jgi:opacity protein-like surface antigen
MRASGSFCLVWLGLGTGLLCAQAVPPAGWYLGGSLEQVNLRIPGRSMEMEGISFTQVQATADKAGFKAYGGYWITEHFGFECGLAGLGNADATFDYAVPPSETGTGVTKVSVNNSTLSFQGAQQLGQVTLFLRAGVQFWRLSYETTFRLSTGESQYRLLDKKGNSLYYGGGLEWKLRDAWHLRLEGELLKMDITDARVISLGVTYRLPSLR